VNSLDDPRAVKHAGFDVLAIPAPVRGEFDQHHTVPPARLIELALERDCLFAIDTDAHAPGQLDFQVYGCERAEDAGIPAERIVNTWPRERLLAWAKK